MPTSETGKGVVNGCSGGMDSLARWWSRVFFSAQGKGKKLAFTGCCDEHDLFYEQGGCSCDRAFADRILRICIAANLKKRKRPLLVRLHVPLLFWFAVRVCGWYFWFYSDSSGSSGMPGSLGSSGTPGSPSTPGSLGSPGFSVPPGPRGDYAVKSRGDSVAKPESSASIRPSVHPSTRPSVHPAKSA